METIQSGTPILQGTDNGQIKRNWTYDIECLINFFCVCFKSGDDRIIFEISDRKNELVELKDFLEKQVRGLKGYNNLAYDSQLIEWLTQQYRVTPYELYRFSQSVIDAQYPVFPEYKLTIPNLDIFKILHLDNKNRRVGLKWCEFMIDWHNIEDMPHPHYKPLTTDEEIDETIHYCWNDVDATEQLFIKYAKEIELRVNLSQRYNLNLMNASNSKIGSELMLKLYAKATNQKVYNLRKQGTERSSIVLRDIIFPYISFDSRAFSSVLEHFNNTTIIPYQEQDISYSIIYKGLEYVYGLGGIHGSVNNKIITIDDDELLIDADVASLYPSIAVVNNLYPIHLGSDFAQVYNKDIVAVRLAEKSKPNGDKTIIAGLKEAANSVYGC